MSKAVDGANEDSLHKNTPFLYNIPIMRHLPSTPPSPFHSSYEKNPFKITGHLPLLRGPLSPREKTPFANLGILKSNHKTEGESGIHLHCHQRGQALSRPCPSLAGRILEQPPQQPTVATSSG